MYLRSVDFQWKLLNFELYTLVVLDQCDTSSTRKNKRQFSLNQCKLAYSEIYLAFDIFQDHWYSHN